MFTAFKDIDVKGLNDNLLAVISGGIITPVARTISSGAVVASGSVASGANMVIFQTSDDFVGTINGVDRIGSFVFPPWQAGLNNTLPAIAYTISAGTLYIDRFA